jgi:hypothetical protein
MCTPQDVKNCKKYRKQHPDIRVGNCPPDCPTLSVSEMTYFSSAIPHFNPQKKSRWNLIRDRTCKNCGATFPKGSSVGKFLSHIQKCKPRKHKGDPVNFPVVP